MIKDTVKLILVRIKLWCLEPHLWPAYNQATFLQQPTDYLASLASTRKDCLRTLDDNLCSLQEIWVVTWPGIKLTAGLTKTASCKWWRRLKRRWESSNLVQWSVKEANNIFINTGVMWYWHPEEHRKLSMQCPQTVFLCAGDAIPPKLQE